MQVYTLHWESCRCSCILATSTTST
jgi:hypothetical protein